MKEKFEHNLVNKIKDVFDSHEVGYNPQDWEMLKEKLPEKRSRFVPLLWTMAKAASIILLVTIGSYMLWDGLVNHQPQIQDNELMVQTNQDSVEDKKEKSEYPDDSSNFINQEYLSESTNKKLNTNNYDKTVIGKTEQLPIQIKEMALSDLVQSSEINTADVSEMDSLTVQISETKDIRAETRKQYNDSIIEPSIIALQQTATQLEVPPEIIEKEASQKQKVRLGVEFASFTNYAPENINPSLNYGGGLAAHIPIKKRFSFNPGLIVSVYNIEFPDNNSSNINIVDETFTSFNNIKENYPEIEPIEMNLTGLDIPINFQYQFIKLKSSNYFVELGFSSMLYLSENYSYTFSTLSDTPNPHGGFEVETKTEEVSTSGSKTFDFAKLINFSVGMDYRLNKRLDLTINPYLKYPVSTLASGDIKFGSGGLKLKFMLKPGK